MKIRYVVNSVFPNKRANSVHIMKMCEAFAKKNIDVELCSRTLSEQMSKAFEYYGIKKKFKSKDIYIPKIFRKLYGAEMWSFLFMLLVIARFQGAI